MARATLAHAALPLGGLFIGRLSLLFSWFARVTAWARAIARASCQGLGSVPHYIPWASGMKEVLQILILNVSENKTLFSQLIHEKHKQRFTVKDDWCYGGKYWCLPILHYFIYLYLLIVCRSPFQRE